MFYLYAAPPTFYLHLVDAKLRPDWSRPLVFGLPQAQPHAERLLEFWVTALNPYKGRSTPKEKLWELHSYSSFKSSATAWSEPSPSLPLARVSLLGHIQADAHQPHLFQLPGHQNHNGASLNSRFSCLAKIATRNTLGSTALEHLESVPTARHGGTTFAPSDAAVVAVKCWLFPLRRQSVCAWSVSTI